MKFSNFFISYKIDYQRDHPIIQDSQDNIFDDDDKEDDIYISNNNDIITNELLSYLEEKRTDKKVY